MFKARAQKLIRTRSRKNATGRAVSPQPRPGLILFVAFCFLSLSFSPLVSPKRAAAADLPAFISSTSASAKIRLSGFALSTPGQFGQQYFYLLTSGRVVQIYNYWKRFPAFKINDYLEISAQISRSDKIIRFKTKEASDIIISQTDALLPRPKLNDDLTSASETPRFVSLKGNISSGQKNIFSLNYAGQEVKLDFKNVSDFSGHDLNPDTEVIVSGLLFSKNNEFTLFPRLASDLFISQAAPALIQSSKSANNSINKPSSSGPPNSNPKAGFPGLKYLALILTCFLIFIIIRKH